MPYKPMDERTYRKYLSMVGWELEKGHIDYRLLDEEGAYLCTIQIGHSSRGKREVVPYSVKKTEFEFKEKGWVWPPKKKLKHI